MSDSATWVAVGLAIGAAGLALVAALVVLPVVVRGRRSSYARSSNSSWTRTSFFERADEALYQAKEAGKGQFMAADEVA